MRARLVTVLLFCTLAFAKGSISTIPITTIIADSDATGVPYDIQSDGLGAYLDNTAGVTSYLTSNGYNGQSYGDWQFSGLSSTTRTIALTFSSANAAQAGDPAYTAPANPPFWGTQKVTGHVEDKCTLINNNMLHMTAGLKFTCPMIVRFVYNGNTYRLLAARSWATDETETTDVQVSCNSADSGGCNDWYLDPIPVINADGSTSPGKAIARLNFYGKRSTVDEGDYYIRFHYHLTRP